MKNSTKKTIFSLFVAMFMLSSILFYGSRGVSGGTEMQTPDRLIYTEELPEETETAFIRQGFTIAKYYYPPMCVDCGPFVQKLESTVMNELDNQMILEKMEAENFNKTLPYMKLKSVKSVEEIEGLENMTQFYEKACLVLLQPPTDCVLV